MAKIAALDVKSFLETLEAADCPSVLRLNVEESETWLYKRCPERLTLLQWGLEQLEPTLCDRFAKCGDQKLEEAIVTHAKSFGLSAEADALLGCSTREKQDMVWWRLLSLLRASNQLKPTSPEAVSSPGATKREMLTSLTQSKDFKDLLSTKISLIPLALRSGLTVGSRRDLEEELQSCLVTLENCKKMSSQLNEEWLMNLDSLENYEEKSEQNLRKIQECYQHLQNNLFPGVKAQVQDQRVDVFGSSVENLVDYVIGFVQMLKDTEIIKDEADKLLHTKVSCMELNRSSQLQQLVSNSQSLVSEVLSLMKVHKMM